MQIESFVGMVVSVVSVLVLSKYKRIARLYEMLAMNVDVAGEGDG
jgi:hypothetical protein